MFMNVRTGFNFMPFSEHGNELFQKKRLIYLPGNDCQLLMQHRAQWSDIGVKRRLIMI